MKIGIASMGNNLESQVDPKFGRCAYFIIADPDTMDFEAVNNMNIGASGGAGIRSGQLISEKGITTVLTGNVGPNAFQTLQAAGIEIITGVSGTVKDVIIKYKKSEYRSVDSATVDSHFGLK
jgi:predicted Fe-Mo cluster-binding NifX family protein